MRVFVMMLVLLGVQSVWALPEVGEIVTYKGQKLAADGTYDIERTIEILAYDPQTTSFQVKYVHKQWGEGMFLGMIEKIDVVLARSYLSIEQGLIPMLKSQCGIIIENGGDPARRTLTSPTTVVTGLGLVPACRVETPSVDGSKAVQWWSSDTAPWPARTLEADLTEGSVLTLTIESLHKPSRKITPQPEDPPTEPAPPSEPKPRGD